MVFLPISRIFFPFAHFMLKHRVRSTYCIEIEFKANYQRLKDDLKLNVRLNRNEITLLHSSIIFRWDLRILSLSILKNVCWSSTEQARFCETPITWITCDICIKFIYISSVQNIYFNMFLKQCFSRVDKHRIEDNEPRMHQD